MMQARRKRKGLFGASAPGQMPGLGMQSPSMMPEQPPQAGQAPQAGFEREKPKALGVISDFLSGMAGGGANYANGLHARNRAGMEAQREAQMAEAKRAADREDFMFEHDYRTANRAPAAPDAFERALAGAGIDPSTPEGQQMYRARAESMARDPNDEFVVLPLPGGRGTYAGPRSGMADALGGGGITAPVGRLTPITEGGPAFAPGTFR